MHESVLRLAVLSALLAPTALAQHLLRTIDGTQADAGFGATLSSIADRDGDGRRDLVVGAPAYDAGPIIDCGQVSVLSSGTGIPITTRNGTALNEHLGTSVAGLGDTNGDSFPDFAAGAPGFGFNTGKVVVYSGLAGFTLATFVGEPQSEFGTSIAGLDDVTGDGRPDLAIGSPHDSVLTPAGAVHYYSVPNGFHHRVLGSSGALFGTSIAAIGDTNGDGRSELAIGAPMQVVGVQPRGQVTLVDPLFAGSNSLLWTTSASSLQTHFGSLVAAAGDRNLDGIPDVLVGDGQMFAGFLRGTNGLALTSTTQSQTIEAAQWIGDIDGNGLQDFAIGMPLANGSAGRVMIFLNGVSIVTINGTTSSARFGASIVGLGDVDGDGRDDFAVGAPNHLGNGGAVGRISIFSHVIPGTQSTSGTGCAGGSGIALLSLAGQPVFGASCTLRASGLNPTHPGLWLLGFSSSLIQGQPLPLTLTPFGYPGCQLYNSADVVEFFLPNGSPTANHALPTNTPVAIGLRLYCQASQLSPSGDLSMSRLLSVRFGNE